MLSLPTVITFIPEHIEYAHQSDIISFFADKIDAVFELVLYCLVLIVIMLILQFFLLFSFVWKLKKDNMIPIPVILRPTASTPPTTMISSRRKSPTP